jgi:polar amino acid transport system substrate-binding protein
MHRRTYLKTGAGAAAGLGLAGCIGGDGGDGAADGGDGGAGGAGGTDGETAGGAATTAAGTGTADGEDGGGDTAIVAGTAPGFRPFEMKEGGELVGFDVDLLEAVIEQAEGYTLSGWQEFEFSSLIPALTSEKIDTIAAAMTINDERDETIDFTEPYYSANQSVLVREGGEFSPSSLADLSGQVVGAQTGTTGEGVVQDQLINRSELAESNYNSYGNYVLAVEDLVNGNIDAIVIDEPVAATFASDRQVDVAFTYETGEEYGFGIRDGASDLQSALDSGLEAVREAGTYEELTKKWFEQDG